MMPCVVTLRKCHVPSGPSHKSHQVTASVDWRHPFCKLRAPCNFIMSFMHFWSHELAPAGCSMQNLPFRVSWTFMRSAESLSSKCASRSFAACLRGSVIRSTLILPAEKTTLRGR